MPHKMYPPVRRVHRTWEKTHGGVLYYHMPSKGDGNILALVTWIKNISQVSVAKPGKYELIQVTCTEIILSHFESI